MPIGKPELRGTEKDGSKSQEYCLYCYQNGAFINPGMNMEEMKTLVKGQMEKMKMEPNIINIALKSIPHLKRWSTVNV